MLYNHLVLKIVFAPILMIINATALILIMIIGVLLIMSGVEPNPGPGDGNGNSRNNLTIITYNCNGLGDTNKLRRVLII